MAVVVGVEHETALVDGLEQHRTRGRLTSFAHGGDRHRRRLRITRGTGFLQQVGKRLQRLAIQIGHGPPFLFGIVSRWHRHRT